MRQTPAIQAKVREAGGPSVLAISAITVAEIRCGIEVIPNGRRKDRLAKSFGGFLDTGIDIRPFAHEAAEAYGRMAAELQQSGVAYSFPDLAIAATALVENKTVASNDDFFGHAASVCGFRFERWEP